MSGTQSPPLEFTGEEKVLGAPATNKPVGEANVKMDAEQRGAYFGGKAEETKQSRGGSDIGRAAEAADDSIKRTDAKYQEAKELGY